MQRSITFPHDSHFPGNKVRAMFDHRAAGDNQLSFDVSDVIAIIGAQHDGWQFGENSRTRQ